jgi:hypothetical protein
VKEEYEGESMKNMGLLSGVLMPKTENNTETT